MADLEMQARRLRFAFADLPKPPKPGWPDAFYDWAVQALAFLDQVDRPLTPSADVPACRDEDPAHQAALAACYPDPPEYQHPEDD